MGARAEFGIRLPVAGPMASPEAIGKAACWAEALGYDTVWVYDHIVWGEHQDETHISIGSLEAIEAAKAAGTYAPNFYESIASMAYLAGLTRRVRIGVAVLCLPYRHPVVVAKQLATIDRLSHGRLDVGIGVGALKTTNNFDFEVVGVPRPQKYERTGEYLKVLKLLWTDPAPSFEGQFISFPAAEMYPKPLQTPHPPVYMSAKWDPNKVSKGVDLVAEHGDGWFAGGILADQVPQALAAVREMARAKGRGDVEMPIAIEVSACVARNGEDARRAALRTEEAGVGHFSTIKTIEDARRLHLVGSTDEIRERVARYISAGVRHVEIKFIYHNLDHLQEQMTLWSEEITPAFRAAPVAAGS